MKVIKALILTILLLSIVEGCKKNDTVGPDDTNGLVAYLQCPQTDIDWPSLADSPWPMFLHDPQHTSRSPLAGPQNGTFTRIGPVNEEIFSSPAVTEDGLIIFGAEGSSNNRIRFTKNSGATKWYNIFLYNDENSLKYCDFSYGNWALKLDGTDDNTIDNSIGKTV